MICEYGCGKEAIYKLSNGKWCCENQYGKCSESRKRMSEIKKTSYKLPSTNPVYKKIFCKFCGWETNICNIRKHEEWCYLNPKNIKLCPICNEPIKSYRHNVTCSSKCARKYFEEMYKEYGRNNGGNASYTRICFEYHKKECIICGEKNIVAVHHYDGDNTNNSSENLIPLCPTHHQYYHSSYRYLVDEPIWLYYLESVGRILVKNNLKLCCL